ncbi:MAG TPA: hypothetical protein DEQ02_00250 [Ruminococcaceae bacterium]|nr:hypothetical protein [Oscillospiraceae bacterium]
MAERTAHEGHRDRLRERFLKEGLDSFEKHNILELLLFYSIARRDTNETAHRLIGAFGSLSAVLDAPYEELVKIKGISENTACLLKMIPGLSRAYQDDKYNSGELIVNSTEAAGDYLLHKYIGINHEVTSLLSMDGKGAVRNWSVVSEGSVNAAEVSTRKVVEIALRHNATSVIIAHNHPSGIALPSRQDIATTEKLVKALDAVGIFLVDHIILADGDYVSMADSESLKDIFG